ncbi:hypothetical protein, partial [Cerasicoccus frondis]|uniref:hypothetical protein n=1 Tax=Cerasicoccus frondis TaxID=490090 RepID=UPI0028529C74
LRSSRLALHSFLLVPSTVLIGKHSLGSVSCPTSEIVLGCPFVDDYIGYLRLSVSDAGRV